MLTKINSANAFNQSVYSTKSKSQNEPNFGLVAKLRIPYDPQSYEFQMLSAAKRQIEGMGAKFYSDFSYTNPLDWLIACEAKGDAILKKTLGELSESRNIIKLQTRDVDIFNGDPAFLTNKWTGEPVTADTFGRQIDYIEGKLGLRD